MNFGERFKAHAKTLAEAAKQFQSFDEMAAQDDYIHSDSLNVVGQNSHKPLPADDCTTDDTNSVTSFPTRTPPTPPPRKTSDLLDSLISPITTVVPHDDEILQQSFSDGEPHLRSSGTTRKTVGTSSTIDSLSERYSHDQQPEQGESHFDNGNNEPDSAQSNPRSFKRKSSNLVTNRFMQDLDDRLSKPNVDVEQGLSQSQQQWQQPSQVNAVESSTNDVAIENAVSTKPWGWRVYTAASRMNELLGRTESSSSEMVPFRSPLSRSIPQTSNGSPSIRGVGESSEEDFDVVQSSAILGADDQAELDRIRLGTRQHGDPITVMLKMAEQNPQFAFILFTLLLGFAMYFYSRFQGAEDDVN